MHRCEKFTEDDLGLVDTRVCPSCLYKMIQVLTGESKTTVFNPTRPKTAYEWEWWCGCGKTLEGGYVQPLTKDEWLRSKWRKVNATYPR